MPAMQKLRRASQRFALTALALTALALVTLALATLASTVAAVGSAHAATVSCPTPTELLKQARTVSPMGGAFATPILPSGGEARLVIDGNQTDLEGQRQVTTS